MNAAPNQTATLPVISMTGVAANSMRDLDLVITEDVNWQVMPGDYWVVAGLQGTGKSDFLMMTAGLLPPKKGHYEFVGEPMPIFEQARLPQRLRLGLVFETGQLFNHLTVRENIALPVRYHGNLTAEASKAQVDQIMEEMDLAEWADTTPGNLGRNWQKRVGLARALALKPEVLLLDGPLAGLDLRHTNWWLRMLDSLSAGESDWMKGTKLTLVATASDLRPWKGRARQFAIMREKRLSVLGNWEQLEAASKELLHELFEPSVSKV
jgi:ABC-type transporter Mla maintaining outer membrane lipid asymmetry ATPase subunit MlaF